MKTISYFKNASANNVTFLGLWFSKKLLVVSFSFSSTSSLWSSWLVPFLSNRCRIKLTFSTGFNLALAKVLMLFILYFIDSKTPADEPMGWTKMHPRDLLGCLIAKYADMFAPAPSPMQTTCGIFKKSSTHTTSSPSSSMDGYFFRFRSPASISWPGKSTCIQTIRFRINDIFWQLINFWNWVSLKRIRL